MRTHLRSKTILYLAATVLVLAFASCTTDSPTEPQQQPAPSGGGSTNPSTTWNITITSSRAQLEVDSTRSATLTIRVRDSVNGALPPEGAVVTVTTTLGELGVAGSGATSTTVSLLQGQAQVLLFPGDEEGTATVTARLEQSFGQLSIPIVVVTIPEITPTPEPDVFFVQRVDPDEGSPDGGETVRIIGQEFESPVRVTFGGLPAEVLGVTSNTIRVRTPRNDTVPPPPAIGRLPVDVSVTINVNEVREATDTLASGFTYTRGTVGVQPVIFSVTPNLGPNEGGTRVTINGDGFADPVQVLFTNGSTSIESQVESVSRTQIVALSPAATGFGGALKDSLVDIVVRNLTNGLEVTRTAAFTYGINFVVFDIDPSEGPFFGGTRVTIFGEGFDEPLVVDFGGVRQQVTSVTGNQILVRTQPVGCSAAGGGPVVVTHLETNRRTPINQVVSFDYFGLEITGVVPLFIDQDGGPVTISGRPFRSPSRGSIKTSRGPERLLTITNVSPTSISANVPAFSDADFNVDITCDDNGDGFPGVRFVTTPATLTIIDEQSACSATFPVNIEPNNTTCRNDVRPPPAANFTANANGLTVTFTDASTGDPTSWTWNFGDGGTASTQGPHMHTYAAAGTYTVTLTARNSGGQDTASQSVTVAAPPPPPPPPP